MNMGWLETSQASVLEMNEGHSRESWMSFLDGSIASNLSLTPLNDPNPKMGTSCIWPTEPGDNIFSENLQFYNAVSSSSTVDPRISQTFADHVFHDMTLHIPAPERRILHFSNDLTIYNINEIEPVDPNIQGFESAISHSSLHEPSSTLGLHDKPNDLRCPTCQLLFEHAAHHVSPPSPSSNVTVSNMERWRNSQ